MIVDPIAQELHHKFARGAILTAEERQHLEQWYAKMDEEEAALFAKTMRPPVDLDRLQGQIDDVLAQIVDTAQKIKTQEVENERKRSEIDALKKVVAQKLMPQHV